MSGSPCTWMPLRTSRRFNGVDPLIHEPLTRLARLPHVDVAEAAGAAQHEVHHQPLGWRVADLGHELLVDLPPDRHVLHARVFHDRVLVGPNYIRINME